MTVSVSSSSSSSNIIDLFMHYTEGLPSPYVFRKWAGLMLVSAALERRVHVKIKRFYLRPNLWVLLVAPPGIGKSTSIVPMRNLLLAADLFNVGPLSMTKAAFEKQLGEKPEAQPDSTYHHPLVVAVDEFGTLITQHDLEFLNTMQVIYDCPPEYTRRTKGEGLLRIEKPHFTLIGGTQPKYLASTLPEEAYEMGFTSRTIMVYDNVCPEVPLFSEAEPEDPDLAKTIIAELERLKELRGEFSWSHAGASALTRWHDAGMEPVPSHPKLLSYNSRRLTHVCKLSMIYSAARGDSLIIDKPDVEAAIVTLLDAEATMVEVFRGMHRAQDGKLLAEAQNFVIGLYMRTKKPVREHMLVQFFLKEVEAYRITNLIQTMVEAKMIRVVLNAPGARTFEPVDPRADEVDDGTGGPT